MSPNIINRDKIVYPELSYQIMSALFKVHTELGSRYQEKYYQRAVALEFDNLKLKYQKELMVNLIYQNHPIGKYFLDFLVENKIIVELKAVNQFTKHDIKQVLAYLKAKKLELGILINFKSPRLQYLRILNSEFKPKY